MRIYELLFIVDPNVTDEQVDAVIAQVEGVVKDAGGEIDKVDRWGIRRLAYRVKKREEGFYILVQFSAAADTVKELERRLRVEELVLKYLTVRIDEELKWAEKRRKQREKRMKRKPQMAAPAPAAPSHPAPGQPLGEVSPEVSDEEG
jgi:small subunit ribosomal protein S6